MPALNQRHKEIQFLGVNLYSLFSLGAIVIILILLSSSPNKGFTLLLSVFLLISLTIAGISLRYNHRLYLIGFIILGRLKDQRCSPSWYGNSPEDYDAL